MPPAAAQDHPPATRRLTLVASDVAPIGGMERVAFELCSRLLARGWTITVIARSCALPPHPRLRFRRLYAPSRPVSVALAASFAHGTLALWRWRDGLVQTNNAIVANRVDVVNVHFCERAYRERIGTSRSRRDSRLYRLNSWLVSGFDLLAERWCYRPGRVRRLACVSRGVADDVAEFYPGVANVTRTIPNGVDRVAFAPDAELRARTRASMPADESELIALFVGGDWQRKGVRHAIEAVAAAPGWRLVVVGAGDEAHFAELARRCGADGRVRFTGRLADPRPWYAAADVLLLPSTYEAFPLVTLEAAAAGLAIVAPRINGTDEVVQDGVNGWFAPADGAAIAARLRELGQDRDRLARMRDAARRTSERYDWDRIVDRYEDLYGELTDTRPAAAAPEAHGSAAG
jgi:UDP-glucose:(heptosyl)LPS alpha-1,3-glucosyltransferase